MACLIKNVSDGPVTIPLFPSALVGAGKSVVYANLDPDDVMDLLGGADAIAGVLTVDGLTAAHAASNGGLAFASAYLIVPSGESVPNATSAHRGGLLFVQGDDGVADDVMVSMKAQDGTYSWVSLIT